MLFRSEAMDTAVGTGILSPEVVIIDARRRASDTTLPVAPIAVELLRYDRPAPTLTGYDDLLNHRKALP